MVLGVGLAAGVADGEVVSSFFAVAGVGAVADEDGLLGYPHFVELSAGEAGVDTHGGCGEAEAVFEAVLCDGAGVTDFSCLSDVGVGFVDEDAGVVVSAGGFEDEAGVGCRLVSGG